MKNVIKKLMISSCVLLSGITFSISANAETRQPQAVDQVDIDRYMGEWYEIAHIPFYFQRKCVADVNANYSLNPDKTVNVTNRCRVENGEFIESKALATAQNDANSQLKVSFLPEGLRWLPFTKGDYWILRLDPEYKVALVGGPSHKYLWILARDRQIDEATYQSYLATAQEYGYDVNQLVKLPHHSK